MQAETALTAVAAAVPDNPRLVFLNAQVDSLRFQELRRSGADGDHTSAGFDDADAIIAEAGTHPGGNTGEVEQLATLLDDARLAERVAAAIGDRERTC